MKKKKRLPLSYSLAPLALLLVAGTGCLSLTSKKKTEAPQKVVNPVVRYLCNAQMKINTAQDKKVLRQALADGALLPQNELPTRRFRIEGSTATAMILPDIFKVYLVPASADATKAVGDNTTFWKNMSDADVKTLLRKMAFTIDMMPNETVLVKCGEETLGK